MEILLVLFVTSEQDQLIQTLYNTHEWELQNIGTKLSEETKSEIYKYSKGNTGHASTTTNLHEDTSNKYVHSETIEDNHVVNKDIQTHVPVETESRNRTGLRSSSKKRSQLHTKQSKATTRSRCEEKKKGLSSKEKHVGKNKGQTNDHISDSIKPKNAEDAQSVEKVKSHHVSVNKETPDRKSKHWCSKCTYSTDNKSNFLRHTREVHIQERHPCSQCNKTFKSKREAKSHLLLAHEKRLQCDKCEKTFSSRGGLLNHTKQIHQKKALYQCNVCNATFFYRQHYLGHMNKHSATKPYSCCHCSKAFVYKCTWRIHEKSCRPNTRTQSNTKAGQTRRRVLCDICGEELSCKAVLITHRRLVHSHVPKSECSECGKTFKGVHSLKRHVTIAHTAAKDAMFPCEICGKSFNQVQVLREHVKRHKKEFSVYCQTCGKGFYTNYKLTEHERIHTGEKPFSCPLCTTFKCSSKYKLKTHLKGHENGRQVREKKKKTDTVPVVSKEEIKDCDERTGESHIFSQSQGEVQRHSEQSEGQCQGQYTDISISGRTINNNTADLDRYPGHSDSHFVTGTAYLLHSNHVPSDIGQHGLASVNLPVSVNQHDLGLYHSSQGIHSNVVGYDQRVQSEGYYSNTSAAVAQGLNILTAAMNIVDQNTY